MRCLLPSSAGLAGWGLSLQSRCGAPLARGNLPGLAGHVAEPAIPLRRPACAAPCWHDYAVSHRRRRPWCSCMCCKPLGGESSVVPPAFVQTVLPATFVQKKLLPAIFV